jgi:arylsulfatase
VQRFATEFGPKYPTAVATLEKDADVLLTFFDFPVLDDMKFLFYQQPGGWPGPKTSTDMPMLVNLRQDPFERTPMLLGETSKNGAWGYGNDFFGREAWRFVAVQQAAMKLALTAVDYPPMQDPASFNLSAVKAQVEAMIKAHEGK